MDSSDPVFRQLAEVRDGLLRLHKALLDGQKTLFEGEHGRVASANELLQLVIYNPQFDWLHRLSELVVEIDEATDSRQPLEADAARGLLGQVRQLLSDGNASFGQRLNAAVAEDEAVAKAYRDVLERLG